MTFPFKPTKQQPYKKHIIGFDIETYSDDNTFLMGSIYSTGGHKKFFTKEDFKKEILKKKYKDCLFSATNLSFDFFGLFFGENIIKKFRFLWRGSSLLSASTYVYKGDCYPKKPNKSAWKIEFIDTLNFALLSVEKIGELLNIPKLLKPSCLGKYPKNDAEWDELVIYNLRDSEISCKFIELLRDGFNELGATFKTTIAQCSMSLFRNKYLKNTYYSHSKEILLELFKAYYGGRVECFKRGYARSTDDVKYKLYDFNSLYPSVMKAHKYPDPSTMYNNSDNNTRYIMKCEGVAKVDIHIPYSDYPMLPYRKDHKLLFPHGDLTGYWSNVELRTALDKGCTIKKVYRNIYFTKTIEPFKDFVDDLYNLRLKYGKNTPMGYICKLLMNSLYGKFAQKFTNRLDLQPFNHTIEELDKMTMIERKGDYIYYRKDTKPAIFCFPEWSLYVTAYGRLKLQTVLDQHNPIYCDTDSIITTSSIPSSSVLGELELENEIDELIIVKPKFYGLKYTQGNIKKTKVKIKGIAQVIQFSQLMEKKTIFKYDKFCKFREGLRRSINPNTKIKVKKVLSLMDNKRMWYDDFNTKYLGRSKPICIKETDQLDFINKNQIMQTKPITDKIIPID